MTVCPVEAFREGVNMLVIDPDECICCGACVPECPAEAIFAEEDVPPRWAEFIGLNARLAREGGWPTIAQKKESLGHPADGKSRRELLAEAPFEG